MHSSTVLASSDFLKPLPILQKAILRHLDTYTRFSYSLVQEDCPESASFGESHRSKRHGKRRNEGRRDFASERQEVSDADQKSERAHGSP